MDDFLIMDDSCWKITWSDDLEGSGRDAQQVHYYDPLGRFICMRNSMIERVGVAWYAEILKRLRQDILQDAGLMQYFGHSLDIWAIKNTLVNWLL